MEDALRVCHSMTKYIREQSLNPCSNGRCSARIVENLTDLGITVLILVLMEDALREFGLLG